MDIYIPYKYTKNNLLILKGEGKVIISQSDIERGDSTDSDDNEREDTTNGKGNGWRISQNGQGEVKRERLTMVASA